jgi:hypothetical protein
VFALRGDSNGRVTKGGGTELWVGRVWGGGGDGQNFVKFGGHVSL